MVVIIRNHKLAGVALNDVERKAVSKRRKDHDVSLRGLCRKAEHIVDLFTSSKVKPRLAE